MGFFTRTAMDALMKTSHPEINRRQCWNLHPHRKPCTECKDICPYGEQIFTRPNLVKDWDPCTECGLCVSACRSGCIIPSPEQVQRDTSAADTDNDTIWIGCEKSTRKNSMVRACISALTWETLAYLALNKKIVLDLTPCGQCENDLCAEQLRKELTRLVDFFGQPMFEARFSLAYEEKEYPYHVQELTRREMLEQVSHGSKSGTKKLLQMLPGLRSEEDSGVDFRLLLHQRTKQLKASMETPLKYGYYLPNFTDKCFGCGKCEKACRAGALKLEDLPDGQTRIVITPWKCSECEVCVASCSNHGIDGMKLRQLTTLGPVSVHKCTKTLCKQCGKPIAPDSAEGLCSVCRIKARTLKRQEEARQRAEQLVEGGEHGVLRDHRHVFLAFVANLQDLGDLRLGRLNRLAAVGFDQDAEERVAVEHGLRQRHRDDHQLVGVHPQPLAGRGHDADDAETPVADAHQLPERGFGSEQLVADLGPDNRFGRAAPPVAWR